SFRQENFLLRFIQGRMLYWMAGYPADEEVPRYRALHRSVWRQELNLTPDERAALRDFLQWNAREENRYYRYDYYRDNCSTRVRDALDRVLHGAIAAQTQGPASGTYRFHTQRLTTNDALLYTGLLLAVGQLADRPITRWDEMFLPLKVRDYLRDVTVTDSTGARVPLVRSEDTLYLSHAYPVPDRPPRWWPYYLLIGLALGGGFCWGGTAGRRGPLARLTLLFGGTSWALLTGVVGLILVGLWGFTDHVIASRNENVLQCTLFALVLASMLPAVLRDRGWALRPARVLAITVAAASVLGVLLKLLPYVHQANVEILALAVPANLGLTAGILAWMRGSRGRPAA
ncbi:MAG TPA: DUF4105 domain-containing protein, partial [Gemmatimonadales bacterium]|nr:DUF4105 domain-containing protein [Gemmatimonadales bacterium]